jgi:hypothetical protein
MAFTSRGDNPLNKVTGPLIRILMDSTGFLIMMREEGMLRKSKGMERAVSPSFSLMTKYHNMTAKKMAMSFKDRFLVKKPFKESLPSLLQPFGPFGLE